MSQKYLRVQQSPPLEGTTLVNGAKNAALVIIASLIMTKGTSTLYNIPNNSDVKHMIQLLKDLGAVVTFDEKKNILQVNTATISHFEVCPDIMNKMRASILVMGPLLARFGTAKVALPGGCSIGARPINYHLQGFQKMGVHIREEAPYLMAHSRDINKPLRITLEYPSVGATENLMMFACRQQHETLIINAALEPEVLNLMNALQKMGAHIEVQQGTMIFIKGGSELKAISHEIIPDRLEAGTLLLAAAATKGSIHLANARADHMDLFLEKLQEIGHTIITGTNPSKENPLTGIKLFAADNPQGVTIKTAPYPGFPTDLQAPTMASLSIARGDSSIEETVFENRFIHIRELQKLGVEATTLGNKAMIHGTEVLFGSPVIATDIRASSALVIAGLVAEGETIIAGIHHWLRGYDKLEEKLKKLGAKIEILEENSFSKKDYESEAVADNSETSRVISD